MENKGLVEASGVVVLDAPLVIAEDVSLLLSGASTFNSTGTHALTVNGVLSVGSADLVPPGNITITGTVNLGTSGGSLTIKAGSYTLDISSTAKFSGTGTLIWGTGSTIIIDGVSGYEFQSTGVQGNFFGNALVDIEDTITRVLVDSIPLAGSHFSGGSDLVIGTVDLALPAVNNPTQIVSTNTAAGSPIPVPNTTGTGSSNISIVNTGSYKPTVSSVGTTAITNASSAFTLAVNAASNLTLADSTSKPPSTILDRFAVIRFVDYYIAKDNLQSPKQTTPFHIGVKTLRDN
jgi:hypothetical protein